MDKRQVLTADVNCGQSDCFVIIGYEPSAAAPGGIGRLLLAKRDMERLVYVGDVRIEVSQGIAVALRRLMDRRTIPSPPIKLQRKRARWITPSLVAEIDFVRWTSDQKLCGAIFKGLRDDADVNQIPGK